MFNFMQPGQFLINKKNGDKRMVLEVLENLVALGWLTGSEDEENFHSWHSKKELKKNGWSLLEEPWVPSLGERYYYLDSYGEIETEEKENNACFQHRTLVGNVHHTKTDAELYKQKLIERMGRKED